MAAPIAISCPCNAPACRDPRAICDSCETRHVVDPGARYCGVCLGLHPPETFFVRVCRWCEPAHVLGVDAKPWTGSESVVTTTICNEALRTRA